MRFSIGSGNMNMGPRGALHRFGENAGGQAISWRVILRLPGTLRPHRRRMAAAFLFVLMASGLTLLAPKLVKVAIDRHIAAGDQAGLQRVALVTALTLVGIYLAHWRQRWQLSWVG